VLRRIAEISRGFLRSNAVRQSLPGYLKGLPEKNLEEGSNRQKSACVKIPSGRFIPPGSLIAARWNAWEPQGPFHGHRIFEKASEGIERARAFLPSANIDLPAPFHVGLERRSAEDVGAIQ